MKRFWLLILVVFVTQLMVGFACFEIGRNSCQQTKSEILAPEPASYTVLNADSVIKGNGDTVKYDHRVHKKR